MATDTKAENKPKTMTHNLTVGACLLLKTAMPRNGWYKELDDTSVMLASVSLCEGELAAVQKEPKPKQDETQVDYDERVDPVLSEVLAIQMTENERKAARECAKVHLKNGIWPMNKHTACLIRELELESIK